MFTNDVLLLGCVLFFFFFKDPATTEIYTLPLHDALPISVQERADSPLVRGIEHDGQARVPPQGPVRQTQRSEEHTSELQSPCNLVCRLLLEKKKNAVCVSHLL